MYDIEREFEELPLFLTVNGKRVTIALVTGKALINVICGGEWDYEEITLASPIADEGDVTLDAKSKIWDLLCESIDKAYCDEIYTETLEIMRGDPDREHDREASLSRAEYMENS